MKFIKIIITSSICLWSSLAFAGSEPSQWIDLDQYKCGQHEGEYGDRVLQLGEACEASTYLNPYLVSKNARIRFWVNYRLIGERRFRRFSQTRTVKSDRDNPYYPFRFPFKGTGQYWVSFDTNNNGYPDYSTNSVWLYEEE